MKHLFISSIILFTGNLFGQISHVPDAKIIKTIKVITFDTVYKWEAYTKTGIIVFGVSPSRAEAEKTIQDFTTRNWKTVYKPLYYTIKKSQENTTGYFKTFKDYCPKGYRLLSTYDIAALRILRIDGLKKAAVYFQKSSKKNYEQSYIYLMNLNDNFKPYRFNIH